MRDLNAIIESHITARARDRGYELLGAVSRLLDADPADVEARYNELETMRDEIVGKEFVQPANTGPHTYIPLSNRPEDGLALAEDAA